MEFRQLRQFLAVVDNSGIVRAAAVLRMAQPSVSQTIRALERELGTPLFHRVGGGLVLTPAGRALVGNARQVLRDVATAEASVVEEDRPKQGCVTFSAVGAAIDYLPTPIAALREQDPAVRVTVHTPDSEVDLLHAVYTGYGEFGVCPVESDQSPRVPERYLRELELESLGHTLFMLVMPPGTEAPDPVPLTDLPDLPVVAAPEISIGRRLVERTFRGLAVHTRIAATNGHRDAQIPLVERGIGMSFLSSEAASWAHRRGCVVRRTDPPIAVELALVYRREPLTPAAQALLDLVRASVAERLKPDPVDV